MAGADSTIYYQVCSFLSYSRGLSNNRTSGFGECLRHFRIGVVLHLMEYMKKLVVNRIKTAVVQVLL